MHNSVCEIRTPSLNQSGSLEFNYEFFAASSQYGVLFLGTMTQ